MKLKNIKAEEGFNHRKIGLFQIFFNQKNLPKLYIWEVFFFIKEATDSCCLSVVKGWGTAFVAGKK